MKRLRRILLNAATALSLVLLVATVALWARSYWVTDVVRRFDLTSDGPPRIRILASQRGRVWFIRYVADRPTSYWPVEWQNEFGSRSFSPRPAGSWGFAHSTTPLNELSYGFGDRFSERKEDVFPHWAVSLLSAVMPSAYVVRRARRRVPKGCCPACGYDLRATPERCPECGALAAPSA